MRIHGLGMLSRGRGKGPRARPFVGVKLFSVKTQNHIDSGTLGYSLVDCGQRDRGHAVGHVVGGAERGNGSDFSPSAMVPAPHCSVTYMVFDPITTVPRLGH